MSKLFQNNAFSLGFTVGFILIILINFVNSIISYQNFLQSKFSAGGYIIGFPFTFYKVEIGFLNYFYFIWFGLFADILIALIFSFLLGLTFKFVWSKISSRRTKLS